ncbi:MAG: ribosomal-protein-alanine acetyltransferase, partial [Sulfitobacter sp.]|nr:ribosomal-protein-alanine acetyltransferase [Sulfitobacter sp.]
WLGALAGLADRAYLEVAADNDPARRLYLSTGFAVEATRPAYYRRTDGPPADAMLMTRAVTLGQSAPRG